MADVKALIPDCHLLVSTERKTYAEEHGSAVEDLVEQGQTMTQRLPGRSGDRLEPLVKHIMKDSGNPADDEDPQDLSRYRSGQDPVPLVKRQANLSLPNSSRDSSSTIQPVSTALQRIHPIEITAPSQSIMGMDSLELAPDVNLQSNQPIREHFEVSEVLENDEIKYPQGVKLAIVAMSLGLALFLFGLVKQPSRMFWGFFISPS